MEHGCCLMYFIFIFIIYRKKEEKINILILKIYVFGTKSKKHCATISSATIFNAIQHSERAKTKTAYINLRRVTLMKFHLSYNLYKMPASLNCSMYFCAGAIQFYAKLTHDSLLLFLHIFTENNKC